MGRKVNVVLWDGSVAAVDEETAARLEGRKFGRQETVVEEAKRGEQAFNEANASKGRAFLEGAADSLTLGLYGKAEGSHRMRVTAKTHPGYRIAGEIAGAVVPLPGAPLAAARAGASIAARTGSKLAGRGIEGAVMGVGGAIARTNVTGDPLTIEAAVEGATIGGVLNVGIGAIGDRLKRAAGGAKQQIAEETEAAAKIATAEKGKAVFRGEWPAWDDLHTARKSADKQVAEANALVRAENEAFEKWASHPTAAHDAVNQFNELRKTLLAGRQKAIRTPAAAPETAPTPAAAPEAAPTPGAPATELEGQLAAMARQADGGAAAVLPKQAPKDLATAVDEAVAKAARFGDRKVFISSVYDNLSPAFKPKTLKEFKDALVEANKRGDVELARADLVAAMDDRLVAASETADRNASYHFLVDKTSRAPQRTAGAAVPESAPVPETPPVSGAAPESPPAQAFDETVVAPDGVDEAVRTELLRELRDLRETTRKLLKNNPQAALSVLSEARDRVLAHLPEAAVPTLPKLPGQMIDDVAVPRLADSLEGFSRQHADTIAAIAPKLTEAETEAVNRLAKELGVEVGENGGATLTRVHGTLKEYAAAREFVDVAEEAVKKEATGSLRGVLRHGARLVGARLGNKLGGGGVVGGAMGWATGYAAGGAAFGLLGGVLMSGKAGIRNRIRDLVAAHGTRAGGAVIRSGPVMSRLAANFLDGKEDDRGGGFQEQAKRRAEEVQRYAMSAGDLTFSAVESILDAPGDVAYKIASQVQKGLNYLAATAPRDPGLAGVGFASEWLPSHQQAMEFAHRLEAVLDPFASIARALEGDGHPAATEALWTCTPSTMSELADEMVASQVMGPTLTIQQASTFSQLFGTPLTGFQTPEVAAYLQGMYLPRPEMAGGTNSAPQPTGAITGRPPATGRTPYTGGNVTLAQSLQSQ